MNTSINSTPFEVIKLVPTYVDQNIIKVDVEANARIQSLGSLQFSVDTRQTKPDSPSPSPFNDEFGKLVEVVSGGQNILLFSQIDFNNTNVPTFGASQFEEPSAPYTPYTISMLADFAYTVEKGTKLATLMFARNPEQVAPENEKLDIALYDVINVSGIVEYPIGDAPVIAEFTLQTTPPHDAPLPTAEPTPPAESTRLTVTGSFSSQSNPAYIINLGIPTGTDIAPSDPINVSVSAIFKQGSSQQYLYSDPLLNISLSGGVRHLESSDLVAIKNRISSLDLTDESSELVGLQFKIIDEGQSPESQITGDIIFQPIISASFSSDDQSIINIQVSPNPFVYPGNQPSTIEITALFENNVTELLPPAVFVPISTDFPSTITVQGALDNLTVNERETLTGLRFSLVEAMGDTEGAYFKLPDSPPTLVPEDWLSLRVFDGNSIGFDSMGAEDFTDSFVILSNYLDVTIEQFVMADDEQDFLTTGGYKDVAGVALSRFSVLEDSFKVDDVVTADVVTAVHFGLPVNSVDYTKTFDVADALAALRLSTGNTRSLGPNDPVTPFRVAAADFNGDGFVTASDALGILRLSGSEVFTPRTPPTFSFIDIEGEELSISTAARKAKINSLETINPEDRVINVDSETLNEYAELNAPLDIALVLRGNVVGNIEWVNSDTSIAFNNSIPSKSITLLISDNAASGFPVYDFATGRKILVEGFDDITSNVTLGDLDGRSAVVEVPDSWGGRQYYKDDAALAVHDEDAINILRYDGYGTVIVFNVYQDESSSFVELPNYFGAIYAKMSTSNGTVIELTSSTPQGALDVDFVRLAGLYTPHPVTEVA